MKKLVLYSEGGFHQLYQSRLNKYRIKKEFIAAVEILGILLLVGVCVLMFLVFVNKSSTEGYFLRKAQNTLTNTEFKYEIVKTDILDLKKSNWNKLDQSTINGPSIGLLDAKVETIIVD
ncbi:MAG: hypothetical protein LBU27_00090 [Candidatus Peribacteria bacterium]|jgi:hypothetical protein|nr:hypothetical protein [Candidatus Peribacteria bacterium]